MRSVGDVGQRRSRFYPAILGAADRRPSCAAAAGRAAPPSTASHGALHDRARPHPPGEPSPCPTRSSIAAKTTSTSTSPTAAPATASSASARGRRRVRRATSGSRREPDADEVTQAIELAFLDGPADEVVFCGFGEPTMRLDVVLAVTEWLRAPAHCRARLDTNGHGQLLNPDVDVRGGPGGGRPRRRDREPQRRRPGDLRPLCRPMFSKALQGRPALRRTVSSRTDIETTLTAVDLPGRPDGCPRSPRPAARRWAAGLRAAPAA